MDKSVASVLVNKFVIYKRANKNKMRTVSKYILSVLGVSYTYADISVTQTDEIAIKLL